MNFNLNDLQKAVNQFITKHNSDKIFVFYGEMGVGKTTFIKALCEDLGVNQNISSPTYSIINEYEIDDQTKIFHMDLYRLNSIEEALDIGIENYLQQKTDYCFIEWPQIIEALLPSECVSVELILNKDSSRTISIINNGGEA